jgi:LacI family transcriptional regulator
MRHKIALLHKEWSETSVRMMEGVFGMPEVRQRYEFRDFPLTRGGTGLKFPDHWQPDGILFTMDEGDPRAEVVAAAGVPAVRMDGEWHEDPFPAVSVDLLGLTRQVLNHFDRLSCPNLLLAGPGEDSCARRLTNLLRRFGGRMHYASVRSVYFRPSPGMARMDQRLEQHPEVVHALRTMPRPFGIVTLRESDALFLANACRELGLRVPLDAGILSAVDARRLQFVDPPITALTVNRLDMGRRAMALLDRLLAGGQRPSRYDRVAVTGINARASTLGSNPLDQSIERVRQMIQQRAQEGITVEEILNHLDMSRPTLEKRYRELTGMSPAQHIRQLRADRARELLLTTNLSITQIARRIGFDDPRPFMVFFKREFGQTPGSFRVAHA